MEPDMVYVEVTEPPARLRSPSPPLPSNLLQPEKDFIVKFETIPELWDTTNPEYSNKYKRHENLAKLLPIMRKIKPDATIEDVKKKINTIRSNYRRELRKMYSAGPDDNYKPKIWYFPYLHFLEKLNPVHLQIQTTAKREQPTPERSFSSVSPIPKPSAPSNKRKKTKHDNSLNRACRCLTEPYSKTESQTKIHPVALEWSDILDRLDSTQRLYAKKAINDILFEAEHGNLGRDSVKINEPHIFQYTQSPRNFSNSLISPPPPTSSSSSPSPSYL